jgi:enoyl-CoA hydratase/carnithine racemase
MRYGRMTAMSEGSVRCDRHDGVAVITLDRPDRLNALTGAMLRALGEHYAACAADDDVRVIVLTGAGRAFSAGADLAGGGTFDAPRDRSGFSSSPVRPPAFEVPKVVIAAVNGHAIGLGCTLALQCDLRFVAADAKLAIPQVRRGVLPDAHSHWTVARSVGAARAAEILVTGRQFTGAEAATWGLCNAALAADEVLPHALEVAREVAEQVNPLSAALSKQILRVALDVGPDAVDVLERDAHLVLMGRADAREGAVAFLERRPPVWESRVPRDLPGASPT